MMITVDLIELAVAIGMFCMVSGILILLLGFRRCVKTPPTAEWECGETAIEFLEKQELYNAQYTNEYTALATNALTRGAFVLFCIGGAIALPALLLYDLL